ncbi:MAG TPA: c-type cytochrome [Vicinamibacterales bacterium]|nr:c-type cytochrome [Vicinamibacterales bacterium]
MSFRFPILFVVAVFAASPAFAQSTLPASARAKVEICVPCHTATGNSTVPSYPILAGQTARYLSIELSDFKAGRRHDPSMDPVAAQLSPADIQALADWFSKQKEEPNGFKPDPAKVDAGRKKADADLCSMCHLGNFSGQNEIPRVAGQHYAYIKKQLEDFRAKRRTNDGGNMTSVAATLTDADIENLAQYVANLN